MLSACHGTEGAIVGRHFLTAPALIMTRDSLAIIEVRYWFSMIRRAFPLLLHVDRYGKPDHFGFAARCEAAKPNQCKSIIGSYQHEGPTGEPRARPN
jgi:hypothetical protein